MDVHLYSRPFGAMIKPMIDSMSANPPGGSPVFSQQNSAPTPSGAAAQAAPRKSTKPPGSTKSTYMNKKVNS